MNTESHRVGDQVSSRRVMRPGSIIESRLTDIFEKVELSGGADKHEVTENNNDQNLVAEHPGQQRVSLEALKIEPELIANRIEQFMKLSLESPPIVHGQKLCTECKSIAPGQKQPPENPFILFRPQQFQQDLLVDPGEQQLPKNTSIVPEQEQVQKITSTVLEQQTLLKSKSKVPGQQPLLRKSIIPKKRPYTESASIVFRQQQLSNNMSVPEQQQFIENTSFIPDQQQLRENTPNILEQQPYPENVLIISGQQLCLENPPKVPGQQPLPRNTSIIPKKRQYQENASVDFGQQQFSKNTSIVPEQQQFLGYTPIISGQQQCLENPPTVSGQQPFQRNTSIIPKKRPHSEITSTVPGQQVLLPINTLIFPRQQQFSASPPIVPEQQQFSKNESNIPGQQQLSASLSMDTVHSSVVTEQQLAKTFPKPQQLLKHPRIVLPHNLHAPQNNLSEEAKCEMMESYETGPEKRRCRLISQLNKGEITIVPEAVHSQTCTSKLTTAFSAATKTMAPSTSTSTTMQAFLPDSTCFSPVSSKKVTGQQHQSLHQQLHQYQPTRRLTDLRFAEAPLFQQPSSSQLLQISEGLSSPSIGTDTKTVQPYRFSEQSDSQQQIPMWQDRLPLPKFNPKSNYQTQDQLSNQYIIQELGMSNLQSQRNLIKEYIQQPAGNPSIVSGLSLENPNNEAEPRQRSD